jgi:hypothetical protein
MQFSRLASMPIALAGLLGWITPAAAVDLTTYVPYQAELVCQPSGNNSCGNVETLTTSKATVLEYVSVRCAQLPNKVAVTSLGVSTTSGGVAGGGYLEVDPNGQVSFGQAVRIYADANTAINVFGFFSGNVPAGNAVCDFRFVGEQAP